MHDEAAFSCFSSDTFKENPSCPIVEHYIIYLFLDYMDHIGKNLNICVETTMILSGLHNI